MNKHIKKVINDKREASYISLSTSKMEGKTGYSHKRVTSK
jgi:hypothetical protein